MSILPAIGKGFSYKIGVENYIGLAESVPGGDAVWVMRSRSESMVQEKQVK